MLKVSDYRFFKFNQIFQNTIIFSTEFARDQAVKSAYKTVSGEVTGFDPSKLKHTEVEEKIALPTKEGRVILNLLETNWCKLCESTDLAEARAEKQKHLSGIENFEFEKLKHVDPAVKTASTDAEG